MYFEVFRFAKKLKFLNKGGIHSFSQVFPGHFYCMRGSSLVEMTGGDSSAPDTKY